MNGEGSGEKVAIEDNMWHVTCITCRVSTSRVYLAGSPSTGRV